jgi:hypothetical protein
MAERAQRVLTEEQARVLFVVWEDKQTNRSRGMTNVEIQKVLRPGHSTKKVPGTSLSNVKKILSILTKWESEPLLTPSRRGKEHRVFQLPKDTMITWATSARMLLLLDSDRAGTVGRSVFVARMLQLGMKNPDTGQSFTKEEINAQIDYCRDRRDPYIEEGAQGFIKTTDRVNRERAFLEKIEKF